MRTSQQLCLDVGPYLHTREPKPRAGLAGEPHAHRGRGNVPSALPDSGAVLPRPRGCGPAVPHGIHSLSSSVHVLKDNMLIATVLVTARLS